MELLKLFLTIIISASGLPIGLLLGRIAQEELAAGKRYFEWLQIILLLAGIVIFLSSFHLRLLSLIMLSLLVSIFVLKSNLNTIISYSLLIILFFLSTTVQNIAMLLGIIIFLYGFPTGALIASRGFIKYMKEEIENPTGHTNIWQTIRYILWVLMLETLSIPSFFMDKENSARYHLKYVCPLCPSSRKRHRDVHGNSTCWWEYNWRRGNYYIPKHFGIRNWIRQYLGFGTNLKEFKGKK